MTTKQRAASRELPAKNMQQNPSTLFSTLKRWLAARRLRLAAGFTPSLEKAVAPRSLVNKIPVVYLQNMRINIHHRLVWRKTPTAFFSAGFTLIETFVAIVIVTTALAGALSLAASGFNSVDTAGEQITASFLAQDAIEYIRFVRDSVCLSGPPDDCSSVWPPASLSACINSSSSGTSRCYLDSTQDYTVSNSVRPCIGGTNNTCPVMYFDPTHGLYNYVNHPDGSINNSSVVSSANTTTRFTRTISIITPVAGNSGESKVDVQVTWVGRNGLPASCTVPQRNCVILQEDLYNWH